MKINRCALKQTIFLSVLTLTLTVIVVPAFAVTKVRAKAAPAKIRTMIDSHINNPSYIKNNNAGKRIKLGAAHIVTGKSGAGKVYVIYEAKSNFGKSIRSGTLNVRTGKLAVDHFSNIEWIDAAAVHLGMPATPSNRQQLAPIKISSGGTKAIIEERQTGKRVAVDVNDLSASLLKERGVVSAKKPQGPDLSNLKHLEPRQVVNSILLKTLLPKSTD